MLSKESTEESNSHFYFHASDPLVIKGRLHRQVPLSTEFHLSCIKTFCHEPLSLLGDPDMFAQITLQNKQTVETRKKKPNPISFQG